MPGSLQGRYIRLELIRINDLPLPSERIPAGFYVSINVDSKRHWKSPVRVVSSDESEVLGDIVILSSREVPELSVEIRVSYELGRMLGNGEVVAKFETSWDELLDRGDEPFDISFPPVGDMHPSLTLKAAVLPSCDNQDRAPLDFIVECDIARETDAGHERFATYVTSKTVSHLNDAVQHFQLVLDQCPVGHPDRAGALTNLAWARLKGYIEKDLQNDLQDIDSITSSFREALALQPQGHPDHSLATYHLIKALTWRNSEASTTAYIYESAQLSCKLLPLCPEGTYLHSIVAGADGVDCVIRACIKHPVDASDEGIHLRRVVLELCPLGNNHLLALSKLIGALRSRFEQCGSINDLDESIQCGREAVSLCSEGHSHRASYLMILGYSLQSRFDHRGNPHDLDEVISLFEEALRLSPVGHESRCLSLGHLGLALYKRFGQCGDVNDIIGAISHQREALTLRPPGNPGRTFLLNNLAIALAARYAKLDVSEDLNEAIDLFRDSLQLRPHGHPLRHTVLLNLSSALCSRFEQTEKDEDVEEVIRLCQELLEDLPSLHPDRCSSYGMLAQAYWLCHTAQRKSADLSLAVENYRLASRHATQGFPRRILLALAWARSSELYQHESALEAYQTCLDLFDNHVMTRSSIISRREAATAFRNAQLLPVDAASCVIRRDNPRRAVELLEQGRGQQWSLASRLRTPLEDLMSASPELADKLSEISKRLSDAQGSTGNADRAAADRAATQYRRLQEQWGAVVSLGSCSRLRMKTCKRQRVYGPVIILIGSQYSRSAIIVMASGEPHHVPLPSVTLTDLKNLKDRFARAIRHASSMGPKVPRNDLIVLLRAVWDEIMLPIVNFLQHDLKLKCLSRIWLCPTGAFTSIPLHAAHPFRTKEDHSGKEACLEDLYICSYTPTLSALVRSRQMMKKHVPPSFVAIGQGQPSTGKSKELLAVDSEIELVRKLVPATANRPSISGDAATRAGALQALQENTWVHLACHGKQDHEQPYNSHFVMRDEAITLLDIMEKDIPHAEFAFLSACHTAVGDEKTPDEVIHLAAGLQFSGFKSVVGTLWEVDDAVAKHVVKAFYENMFEDLEDGGVMDCTKAAWALNRATHAVKMDVPLEQRMVFIHVALSRGPPMSTFLRLMFLRNPPVLSVRPILCYRDTRSSGVKVFGIFSMIEFIDGTTPRIPFLARARSSSTTPSAPPQGLLPHLQDRSLTHPLLVHLQGNTHRTTIIISPWCSYRDDHSGIVLWNCGIPVLAHSRLAKIT
ncbi:CHAT domain-containing protein [Suillus placidus]|uniref:CHAT domain-containing protein n=1 Tax=Suillus placidus TaxID=48579 RepID=A0A9P7D551_9AGAM|nr:CHAT domain-containing protein [Suillus placidus]